MIYNYVGIIDQLKEQITSWDDRLEEDDSFTLENDFMRFRFRMRIIYLIIKKLMLKFV